MLKHTTKFTSLLLAAGTCFSGTICTFAESTSSADAANATEVFSTPLYTSGLYSTNEQPEGVKVTHNICLDYDNNLMKDNYLIQNESDTDVSFDILIQKSCITSMHMHTIQQTAMHLNCLICLQILMLLPLRNRRTILLYFQQTDLVKVL